VATPHYQWLITRPVSAGGLGVEELTEARSRRIEFALDDSAKASWTLPGRHPQTPLVDELATDLVVSRDSVAIFRGRVNASDDSVSPTVHTCTFSAADYRGVLDRRIIWPGSTASYVQVDQAAIAADLINDTQVLGPLGIQTPTTPTGVKRDRTYESGASIGELIGNLGRCENGFDWDISPGLVFRVWWPARGTTTPSWVGEYGRNVSDVRRTVASGDYANAIRFSGKDAVTPPPVTRVVTPGNEGRWEDQRGNTDVTTTAQLNEQANGAILAASVIQPSYSLTLVPGAWTPATVWLGDTIRLIVNSGRLAVDTTTRVVGVGIDIGESGEETVSLQLGRYRWRLPQRLGDYAYRLDRLERR
jgi:hypothetical protein